MRHFPVDAHIYSKREVKRISRATGKSRSEVVGAMVCLWGYMAVHSRDTGTVDGDLEDLADELDQDVEFWQAVIREGWLAADGETISIPHWEERFYTGSNSERCKTYRERKASARERVVSASRALTQDEGETLPEEVESENTKPLENRHEVESERVASAHESVASASRSHRIEEERIKEKKIDRTEAAPAAGLSVCLSEFWENLSRAGISLPDKQPFWLRQSLSNGQAATMLAASRQLGYTALCGGESPVHLGNFKNADWVSRLAAGDFNRPGKGPPPPPVDPEEEYIMFHPAGARMKRKDIREWLKVPANRAAYEAYKDSQTRNVARDKARAEGERTSEPVPEGMEIPRAVLKDPNESFNTEAARENALASIAKWQERNE
jgi:hypothetical protein